MQGGRISFGGKAAMMAKTKMRLAFFFAIVVCLSFQVSMSWPPEYHGPAVQAEQLSNPSSGSEAPQIVPDFERLPLYFIPNQGQVSREALFYAKATNYTLWLTTEGLIFDGIRKPDERRGAGGKTRRRESGRDISRLTFLQAGKKPEVIPVEPAAYTVNYFPGREESKWKTAIPTSKAVLYKSLYPNIDLKIYGVEGQVEYDYLIKPGGKVSDIRFEYTEVKKTTIDDGGNLLIETEFGELRHAQPRCYQRRDGRKVEVAGRFRKIANHAFGFEVPEYDADADLTIDPSVIYSTYLGGADFRDNAHSIAVDSQGAAYVTGWTASADFPLKKPFQNKIQGQTDVFICKIMPLGKQLVYSTFLGGSDFDYAYSIAVDSQGAAYITGTTYSLNDFPLKNPYQSVFGGAWADAFVCKVAPSGSRLVFSTYLGGSGHDYGWGIAVDANFAAYVTGETSSPNFPVMNPIQAVHGGSRDAFVTKLDPSGNALLYSTYLGGSENDNGYAIALDSSQAAYITGNSWSSNFPVQNALSGTYRGQGDAVIAKINPAGNALAYSTYFGGTGEEEGKGIALDASGAVYITGWTSSRDLPLKNALQKTYGGGLEDAFAAKISATGKGLLFSTYVGGSDMDYGHSIAVNAAGNAHLAGHTFSKNFPIKNSLKPHAAYFEADAFIVKLERSGKKFVYSTLYGGRGDDWAMDIGLDSLGQVYVAGHTYAKDFPVKNAIRAKSSKNDDGFVLKIK
jgi:hypothetical protein